MPLQIGGKMVGKESPMFIIAEIGVNHNGSYEMAKKLVIKACEAGADAVKFQTYETDALVSEEAALVNYQKKGMYSSQREMLKSYQLSKKEFKRLKVFCDKKGIVFLSTPFDVTSARLLKEMNVDAIKVGSGDLTYYHLLKELAGYKIPLILSSGMASLEEIRKAVSFLGNSAEVAILHCTSAYPAPFKDLHLNVIQTLKRVFNCPIGYSDHSLGLEVPFAVAAMGYNIIEKHFTLGRDLEGPDHQASLMPDEFARMVAGIRAIESALGSEEKVTRPSELETRILVRRGIYLNGDYPPGHVIHEEDLLFLRPEGNISASSYLDVIGKKLQVAKSSGDALRWTDLEMVSYDK
ncbi:N-acetylneuraminate synthase family protein [Alteribacter keqinensis]|uniref:N-acetylneuraminate synthase n=1 Tax=Alteribacter keqinensis TaxID=2483800 RepID=A0A3M7TMJ7_9BACI|nr:N-acetylneuraminate synthase family protein [Alteribacter keqinensis]RNA66765.1 N-acetylneuraminate synthase [Alteribacter keqinensis]